MPVKIARSAPRPSFGLPALLVAIHTSRQSCCKAGKARIFTPVRESSGESRMTYPTAVRNAEDRSCAPCHARGKVETNDVVFRRNLACTPAGICSTSTWRPVRPNGWFSISTEIGCC
jgi:hypothetical protein